MVGAEHIEGPHETLYYEKQEDTSTAVGIAIGSKVPSLSEVAPTYNQTPASDMEQPSTPTVTPEPVAAPSAGASIGGGGY